MNASFYVMDTLILRIIHAYLIAQTRLCQMNNLKFVNILMEYQKHALGNLLLKREINHRNLIFLNFFYNRNRILPDCVCPDGFYDRNLPYCD